MKRIAAILMIVVVLASTVLCVQAAGSASASGPSVVRAGDTITVSFVAGGGILGGNGSVSFDSSILTLQGYTQVIGGSWAVEFNGNNFVFYDNSPNMDSPINGSSTIFKATFKVSPTVAEGTEISVAFTGVTLSDGKADTVVGTRTYSATIAPPLSDNCNLGSLSVSNATISPAFSPDTTSYSASVPFAVSSLNLTATAADSKAQVSVTNPTLVAGGTSIVRIKVTAENGATKEYTISVARGQDPNYVPSSNANLSDLAVDGFVLSPAFSQDVTRYFVWLPYEQETISIIAQKDDELASIDVAKCEELAPGRATDLTVTVAAEDGTEKVYTLTVFRAPAHEDTDAFLQGEREPEPETEPVTEPVTEPSTEPVTEPVTDPSEPATEPTTEEQPEIPTRQTVLILCLICLVVGLLLGILILLLIQRIRQ